MLVGSTKSVTDELKILPLLKESAPASQEPKTKTHPSKSRHKKRNARRTYSCGMCRRMKIKCDNKVPCSSCIKHNRISQCLDDPANPPSPKVDSASSRSTKKVESISLSYQQHELRNKKRKLSDFNVPTIPASGAAIQLYSKPAHSHSSDQLFQQASTPYNKNDNQNSHPTPAHTMMRGQSESSGLPFAVPKFTGNGRRKSLSPLSQPQSMASIIPHFNSSNCSCTSSPPLSAPVTNSNSFGQNLFDELPQPVGESTISNKFEECQDFDLSQFQFGVPYAPSYTIKNNFDYNNTNATSIIGPRGNKFHSDQDKDAEINRLRMSIAHLTEKLSKYSLNNIYIFNEPEINWKNRLVQLIPTRAKCDAIIEVYLRNVDYIFHTVHHPTFRAELKEFYELTDVNEVNLHWLSLLFMVLAIGCLHLPKKLGKELYGDNEDTGMICENWFKASRQALQAANSDEDVQLVQLQTFSLTQGYLALTKHAELINSLLAKTISQALALGLNVESKEDNQLTREMKRRIWWDICGCDTFRALTLGRPPLIRSYRSRVPLPSNIDDIDLSESSNATPKPMHIPTDNSLNIIRAKIMQILNGVFEYSQDVSSPICHTLSENNDNKIEQKEIGKTTKEKEILIFKGLLRIDQELCEYVNVRPWYFKLDNNGNLPNLDGYSHPGKSTKDIEDFKLMIRFSHHMIQTCICIHRFRVYQPYLSLNIPIAWEVCLSSAKTMFSVYRKLRRKYPNLQKIGYTMAQVHQSFSCSVIQSMMLLIEKDITQENIEYLVHDTDVFVQDLAVLSAQFYYTTWDQGLEVMKKLRKLFLTKASHRKRHSTKSSYNRNEINYEQREVIVKSEEKDINVDSNESDEEEEDQSSDHKNDILNHFSSFFGGKKNTETYLRENKVDLIINTKKQQGNRSDSKSSSRHTSQVVDDLELKDVSAPVLRSQNRGERELNYGTIISGNNTSPNYKYGSNGVITDDQGNVSEGSISPEVVQDFHHSHSNSLSANDSPQNNFGNQVGNVPSMDVVAESFKVWDEVQDIDMNNFSTRSNNSIQLNMGMAELNMNSNNYAQNKELGYEYLVSNNDTVSNGFICHGKENTARTGYGMNPSTGTNGFVAIGGGNGGNVNMNMNTDVADLFSDDLYMEELNEMIMGYSGSGYRF